MYTPLLRTFHESEIPICITTSGIDNKLFIIIIFLIILKE